ncbi:MAG: DUF47 family protein [Magnetococcales bacterium]|nr:DUF47 family protein [Magnetococcales bacterium]
MSQGHAYVAPNKSFFQKVKDNVFPEVPDFFGMIHDQARIAVETVRILEEFMKTGSEELALKVREKEHEGDEIKARNMNVLNEAFATSMDREDIYRAIQAVDEVTNYCKTTVREMEVLRVQPDEATIQIVGLIAGGVDAMERGFGKLKVNPVLAEEDCHTVLKAERDVEQAYRMALSKLFNSDVEIKALADGEPEARKDAMTKVIEIFKRREVYRHLSNTSDQMAKAGHVLHDIVVQIG